jgi:putative transposase
MRKSRFTEAQIIGMIKEQEAGLPTAELCRKHGLSPATFYKLKAKYGGMDLSDAKRLKQLEEENARLKRLVADVMLDNVVRKPTPRAVFLVS